AISYHLLYLCIIKLSCAGVCFDSSFLVGVHVTHEKGCSMPAEPGRHCMPATKRSDSCDSLRILYYYS
ncbi:unnamed protein product, partial [Brassica oleracea var. botrytis]